eukprot:TRINITY_DN27346_c0_g1_i1.p1 TRINITY_DN27346_c0_g1~~TRINITY_DN27346_c0_g1_i1.p1  ORF type:complete len:669 (+),score=118.03 TRINITY_DN27346_c0_g1_i1:85-2091(+)
MMQRQLRLVGALAALGDSQDVTAAPEGKHAFCEGHDWPLPAISLLQRSQHASYEGSGVTLQEENSEISVFEDASFLQAIGGLKAESHTGCYSVKQHEHGSKCLQAINWAKSKGRSRILKKDPDMAHASFREWQSYVARHKRRVCPVPCGEAPAPFCKDDDGEIEMPKLWKPRWPESGKLPVKILSYNLFWWNLYAMHKGNHESAGKLIRSFDTPPYDVMGFQECEDIERVLKPVKMAEKYGMLQGKRAICAAYRKDAWNLEANGEEDVAEDMFTEWYGNRGVIWARLRHKNTSAGLFFLNHHGPLSVNSGGVCGGVATARNILQVVKDNARHGDIIVVVGDFNANALSSTVQTLWKHLVFVYNGGTFGGVDNVFTNAPKSALIDTRDLGKGGSDHSAIAVTMELRPAGETGTTPSQPQKPKATNATNSSNNNSPQRRGTGDDEDEDEEGDADGETPTGEESCKKDGCKVDYDPNRECQCNTQCSHFSNCCDDYDKECKPSTPHHVRPTGLCKEYGCNVKYAHKHDCQCNKDCGKFGSCCQDYIPVCETMRVVEEPLAAIDEAVHSECARQDTNVLFTYPIELEDSVWTAGMNETTTPRRCCSLCNMRSNCQSWVWKDWIVERRAPECYFFAGKPNGSRRMAGMVSGFPTRRALADAREHANEAISEMP